jgi:hypothetical protein
MHSRALRLTIVALLLAAATGAGLVVFECQRRTDVISETERELQNAMNQIVAVAQAVGAQQQAYVTAGQSAQPWFTRVSTSIQQLYDGLAAVRPLTRSLEATGHLSSLTGTVDDLLVTDIRVREHLRLEDQLMAADVVLGDGRSTVDTITAEIFTLAEAERAAASQARRTALQSANVTVVTVSGLWLFGLLLLAWKGPASTTDTVAASEDHPAASMPSTLDLKAITRVASTIASVTDAKQLPGVLGQALPALGATGLVLWMGAGDELFPAATAGYASRVVGQLRPIARSGDNATAQAWTSGEVRIVSGDGAASDAIVAPIFGLARCVGVLAVEVPNGSARGPALQAWVSTLAAQLSGIIPTWPDSSPLAEGRQTNGTPNVPSPPSDQGLEPRLEAASGE